MPRSRHVSVDWSGQAAQRDRVDHHSLSDTVLAARCRDADPRALVVLVERHQPLVDRITSRWFADREDAHDAAQDALTRLVTSVGSYRGDAAFTTWLTRLVSNVCADQARRQARRRASEVPDDPTVTRRAGQASAAEPAPPFEPALREHLAGLSDGQRAAVVLKDALSMRYEDVAALMSLPVGTVKCHAHRGRKRLAARLRRSA
jgi:RNA polymerase sigma-70 factor, ECF subfamily